MIVFHICCGSVAAHLSCYVWFQLSKQKDVSMASKVLLSELTRHFWKYTDPGDICHDPKFLTATALDARYRFLLKSAKTESAKSVITVEVRIT